MRQQKWERMTSKKKRIDSGWSCATWALTIYYRKKYKETLQKTISDTAVVAADSPKPVKV